MKRNTFFLLTLILNFSNLYSQSTQEMYGVPYPNSTPPITSSIATWNNEKIISGKAAFNSSGFSFIKIGSTLQTTYNESIWNLDYPCDTLSSSTALGADLFAMTGTLSDTLSGVHSRPFVFLLDTLSTSQTQIAFTISDTSLNFKIIPKIASTSDGGFILGWTAGNGEGRIVKFNHTGGFVWGHLLSVPSSFYVDDIAVKNNGEIIVAGRNPTSQLQPTLITLNASGQILRAITIIEQQSKAVSLAVSNNTAIAFCTLDTLTTYNKVNLLLFDQNDSLISGNSYTALNCTYECSDLSMYNDTSWLITGSLFPSISSSLEVGFYLKGSVSFPLINDSYIRTTPYYTKFLSSYLDSNGTIWTVGDEGGNGMGFIVMTGLPVDDCNNLAYNSVATAFNPNLVTVMITSQTYVPVLNSSNTVGSQNIMGYFFSCPSDINENVSTNFTVTVFPNPATTNATFQFTGSDGNKMLVIYDQLGKEIWRKEAPQNQIEFSTEGFASGLYFYRVEKEEEIKIFGKLIIQ